MLPCCAAAVLLRAHGTIPGIILSRICKEGGYQILLVWRFAGPADARSMLHRSVPSGKRAAAVHYAVERFLVKPPAMSAWSCE